MQAPLPDHLPCSSLACPPTQAFLDKYQSTGLSIGGHEFHRTLTSGVNVPGTLNFKTKSQKSESHVREQTPERREPSQTRRSVTRAKSAMRQRSPSKEVIVRRVQPHYMPMTNRARTFKDRDHSDNRPHPQTTEASSRKTMVGEGKEERHPIKCEYASKLGPEGSGKVLITRWVDYSSKYGVGVKLSNGCYTVLFNDSTKMVLHPNCFNFVYVRRESSQTKESLDVLCTHLTFADYPAELKKKVILIQHFKSYLDGVKFTPPTEAEPPSDKRYWEIFVKKWRRANKAVLFRLSNRVIQVVFQDTSEIILSSGSGDVTFITSRKEVKSTPLYQDLEKEDPSLFKRLNYAKEILVNMINPKRANEENDPDRIAGTMRSNMKALSAKKSMSNSKTFTTARVSTASVGRFTHTVYQTAQMRSISREERSVSAVRHSLRPTDKSASR